MTILGRLLFALAAAAFAGLASFFLLAFILARLGSCPATVRTCDLPGIAAFGGAFALAPLIAAAVGWLTYRRTGQREAPVT